MLNNLLDGLEEPSHNAFPGKRFSLTFYTLETAYEKQDSTDNKLKKIEVAFNLNSSDSRRREVRQKVLNGLKKLLEQVCSWLWLFPEIVQHFGYS